MRVRLSIVAFMLIVICVLTVDVSAQSTPVQVPGKFSSGNATGINGLVTPSWPPNNLSVQMRNWEAILDSSFPNQFNDETTAGELVNELNELGLPIVITESAYVDALTDDEPIKLLISSSPLRARLLQGLETKNATIVFRRDYIMIVSIDDAEDVKYLTPIVYDVSDLKVKPDQLYNTIVGTVAPDSWQDTGQGLATIKSMAVNGRMLFSISQTYENHRQLQDLFAGFHELGGLSNGSSKNRAVFATSGSSRAVFGQSYSQTRNRLSTGARGAGLFNVNEQNRSVGKSITGSPVVKPVR